MSIYYVYAIHPYHIEKHSYSDTQTLRGKVVDRNMRIYKRAVAIYEFSVRGNSPFNR